MRKLLLAIMLVAALPAQADEYTKLMDNKYCRAERDSKDWLICSTYFMGALHMSIMMETVVAGQDATPPFCVMEEWPSADIIRRLWINFIDDNPKYLAEPIFVSYMHMMRHEYPCE